MHLGLPKFPSRSRTKTSHPSGRSSPSLPPVFIIYGGILHVNYDITYFKFIGNVSGRFTILLRLLLTLILCFRVIAAPGITGFTGKSTGKADATRAQVEQVTANTTPRKVWSFNFETLFCMNYVLWGQMLLLFVMQTSTAKCKQ